ncbi:hypothetical protein NPT74_004603 [Salmonella enterica subsp. enterica serovar Techimani]|uniref:Uncharacterized protein n=1 Tax=Salmonella enterica subsp. enterica serovar Abeokuta TaxID=2926665 RepID=A0A8T9INW0_SALET|nr:hypothetical protein [Salmonella enterica]EDW8957599.1 hypothetical protein [Salmonella enterica subsp. enterica]EEG8796146.1 hypothetical protein [Salmonella enterica subsp. enterica serovar Durham]EJN2870990.1 hypothetical protein [Salmonella enterica subsp. enterica serovar Techimani]EEP8355036.1 hypothetical protein [Salmonella enterica subsp. enterica serovar Durham]EEP8359572.1 hypothetical protein [Salmonella enterica subsp. enterica serovar Durham]
MRWLFVFVLSVMAVFMTVCAIALGEFVGFPLLTLIATIIYILILVAGQH